jgi:RecA-family ATPase
MLSGDGGTGKSWITLQLAAARDLERDWLGLMPEPGSTLVLSAEDDEDEMHRRLDGMKFYAKQSPATWADLSRVRLVDLVWRRFNPRLAQ